MAEHNYSEDEVRAALELSATIGIKPASRELKIGRATIYRWIDRHAELWSDLNSGKEKHRFGFAAQLEHLAERYAGAEHDALERIEEKLDEGDLDAKELAALVKAMGSSRGVAAAGARAARGDHDVVEHQINFPQLERAMQALLEVGTQQGRAALDPSSSDRAGEPPALLGQAEELT